MATVTGNINCWLILSKCTSKLVFSFFSVCLNVSGHVVRRNRTAVTYLHINVKNYDSLLVSEIYCLCNIKIYTAVVIRRKRLHDEPGVYFPSVQAGGK